MTQLQWDVDEGVTRSDDAESVPVALVGVDSADDDED